MLLNILDDSEVLEIEYPDHDLLAHLPVVKVLNLISDLIEIDFELLAIYLLINPSELKPEVLLHLCGETGVYDNVIIKQSHLIRLS